MNARMLVLGLLVLSACSSAPAARPGPPPRTEQPPAGTAGDVLRLTNGEVLQGRIVEETPAAVSIETGDRVVACPRSTIYQVSYAQDSYKARTAPLQPAERASKAAPEAPTTWYPRGNGKESVEQKEILWHDTHPWTDCLGVLAEQYRRIPEMALFVEPGGKIVLHDPRLWGYHAHLFPGDRMHKPVGKPGLSLEMSKEEGQLPEALAFVSPSQEMTSTGDAPRSSYAPPDALYARVRPAGQAEGMLAVQPFAGGRPASTPTGKLWAFSLPRSATQFAVYLYDGERKHGQILKHAFAAYGDTILAADSIIDLEGADGVTLGRVLLVPYPDGVSADGPAPEPVSVYSGPAHDPSPVVTVGLPPREAIQLPARSPSTKATILVSHYEVAKEIPETIVIAHGTGRPTKDVTVVARELTTDRPDELVKIDLSGLGEDRFPAVVWFSQRRTYAWRTTGGMLAPAAPRVRPVRGPVKLTRVKKNVPIPHVLPLFFQGPKPEARGAAVDPAAGVAGGMSNALLTDALAREAGAGLGGLTSTLSPTLNAAPGTGGGGNVTSVTNVYITSPQHFPSDGVGSAAAGYPYGVSLSQPGSYNARSAPFGPFTTTDTDTGKVRDRRTGAVVYDPETGGTGYQQDDATIDQFGRVGVIKKRSK